MMRRTKVISKDCIEVLFKDGKPLRVYPSHDWWHIFVRMAQLEDLAEPKMVTDVHVDEYYCPACGSENNCDQKKVEDKYCPNCGQALEQEEQY